jgi:glycosyltransferase involved in cell wall biosynthesis
MTVEPHPEWIALVGPREEPTDGVRDYCHFLAEALNKHGIRMEIKQVPWAERGWIRGLLDLWKSTRDLKGRWILLQYTPLAWSRRGFPFGALAVMAILRLSGVRPAVMFHDWTGYTGPRAIDRFRWALQRWTMHRVAALAERSILPALPRMASWLGKAETRAVFIPIGANLPEPMTDSASCSEANRTGRLSRNRVVGVYGFTGVEWGKREAMTIGSVLRATASRIPGIRLVALGRGSKESQPYLERALNGAAVELSVLGLLSAEDVAQELSQADALLFVRGEMLGHRGSAIAGIACGIPVVGYGDPEKAFPLSEAGVVLVPPNDSDGLAGALTRVLVDDQFRLDLCERSRRAQAEYFSWESIAVRFVKTLCDR